MSVAVHRSLAVLLRLTSNSQRLGELGVERHDGRP